MILFELINCLGWQMNRDMRHFFWNHIARKISGHEMNTYRNILGNLVGKPSLSQNVRDKTMRVHIGFSDFHFFGILKAKVDECSRKNT